MDLTQHLETRRAYLEAKKNYDFNFNLDTAVRDALSTYGFEEIDSFDSEEFYFNARKEQILIITPGDNIGRLIARNSTRYHPSFERGEAYSLIDLVDEDHMKFLEDYKAIRKKEGKYLSGEKLGFAGMMSGPIFAATAGLFYLAVPILPITKAILLTPTFMLPMALGALYIAKIFRKEEILRKEFKRYKPKFNYDALEIMVSTETKPS